MNLSENMFIFSVFQVNEDHRINQLNHNFVFNALKYRGLAVKEVTGSYKGQIEPSILVIGLANEAAVKAYCAAFNQEAYLMVHNDKAAELKFTDGRAEFLNGTFQKVNDVTGLANYVCSDNQYYAVI